MGDAKKWAIWIAVTTATVFISLNLRTLAVAYGFDEIGAIKLQWYAIGLVSGLLWPLASYTTRPLPQ